MDNLPLLDEGGDGLLVLLITLTAFVSLSTFMLVGFLVGLLLGW